MNSLEINIICKKLAAVVASVHYQFFKIAVSCASCSLRNSHTVWTVLHMQQKSNENS